MNPFKYNTIVSGQDFCGRQNLLNNLIIPILDSSKRVVLLGEKNIGKSSTAFEAVRRYKGAKHLYVDLLDIKSIDSLWERIKRSVILMEQKSPFYQRVTRSFPHNFSLSFDAPLIQMQSNLISEVLASIKSQYKKSRFVVIFDEFQDILNLQSSFFYERLSPFSVTTHVVRLKLFRLKAEGVRRARLPYFSGNI
jgi:hypothetical protein